MVPHERLLTFPLKQKSDLEYNDVILAVVGDGNCQTGVGGGLHLYRFMAHSHPSAEEANPVLAFHNEFPLTGSRIPTFYFQVIMMFHLPGCEAVAVAVESPGCHSHETPRHGPRDGTFLIPRDTRQSPYLQCQVCRGCTCICWHGDQ